MILFKINDTPNSIYNRQWQWSLRFEKHSDRFSIGLIFELIKWQGIQQEPREVGNYLLHFYFNPLKWLIKQVHVYYDGPNCDYQFGPIGFTRNSLGWCDKCSGAKE